MASLPYSTTGTSAERPVHRGAHSCSASNDASAARPASHLDAPPRTMKRSQAASASTEPRAKHARVPTIAPSVAFITCDVEAPDFLSNCERRGLMKAVGNVLDAGATIINIAFLRSILYTLDLLDTHSIIAEILSTLDGTWDHRSAGSLMSFFSTSGDMSSAILETSGFLPAIMLTLDGPTGILCTINVSVPDLLPRTRGQLLGELADAAWDTQAGNILIGGAWTDSVLFTENQVAQLSSEFQLFTNAHLCLITYNRDSSPMKCFPLDTGGPYSLMGIWESTKSLAPRRRSAEQPASSHRNGALPHPRLAVTLRPCTPLYDNFMANMETSVQEHPRGEEFMKYITETCFFGSLLTLDVYGEDIDTPVPLSVKMEELFRAAENQRELQVQRLRRKHPGDNFPHHWRMDDDDMKEIYNTWRKDVQSWMRGSTLAKYEEMERRGLWQDAHQLGKSSFSTYLFQLSGCKFLVHALIRLPIISSSLPNSKHDSYHIPEIADILNELIDAYEDHLKTPQYANAVLLSKQHQAGQLRLSHQVWWAQYNYSQGRKLSCLIRDSDIKFDDLAPWKQKLVEDFDTRRSAKALDRALEQKSFRQQPYRGAGTEVQ